MPGKQVINDPFGFDDVPAQPARRPRPRRRDYMPRDEYAPPPQREYYREDPFGPTTQIVGAGLGAVVGLAALGAVTNVLGDGFGGEDRYWEHGNKTKDHRQYNKYDASDNKDSMDTYTEDKYLAPHAIKSPEIYQGPVHTQGTRLNNNYNDVIFNDTLGQDYDDDGLPYAVDTGDDALSRNYNIDFRVGGDVRSERLQALRSSMRDSMNADTADQAFADARYNSAPNNPFDIAMSDAAQYPRIYDDHDMRGYPEDDTIADIVFGDVVGQDYDNDGVPYAVETPDRPMQNYTSVFDTSNDYKYMTNDQFGLDNNQASDNDRMDNIRRNLDNRYSESNNNAIMSEIARNRLSRRMEQSEGAERAAERAKILEDAKSFGRGRVTSGRRGSGRMDDYAMGGYEPSPAAALAGSYDYEGALLSHGVAARAMGRA